MHFVNSMVLTVATAITCLLCLPREALGQIVTTVEFPKLVGVQPVPNNDAALSYSFSFPATPQYDHIDANYTLYEFVDGNKTYPQSYASQTSSCSITVPCLSSSIPQVKLLPGVFVIGCFQWLLWGANNQNLGTSYSCILGRTTVNSNSLPSLGLVIDPPIVYANNASISVYYPAALPYDSVNISSTINGAVSPAPGSFSSNATFMLIETLLYQNLNSSTSYNICIILDCANSVIRGSGTRDIYCQGVNTLADNAAPPPPPPPTTTTITTTTIMVMTTTVTVAPSSATMLLSNFTLLLFFLLLVVL